MLVPDTNFALPWMLIAHAVIPMAVYWTAGIVALSLVAWAGLRGTRWGKAAGWIALALAGQACALQLLDVGPSIRLQLFHGWSFLFESSRIVFLGALLAQAGIVFWGTYRVWPAAKNLLPKLVTWRQGLLLLALEAYAAITIAPGVAQALVQGGFARQAILHSTKIALGLAIFGVGALNLGLATAAIPADAWEKILAWWRKADRARLPWLCALWVVAVSSLLAWSPLERMPHIPDEVAYIFEAKYFSLGRLWHAVPPDPNALYSPFNMVEGSKWFNAMPAGWPFVLAVGMWAGVPWLVNPVLGGVAILLAHAWVRRIYDRNVADGATLLLAASPWLLFMSANLLPHTASLVCALLGLLGVERAREAGNAGWAGVAGLAFGALLHVRPLEAVIVAGVAGTWWLMGGWKKLKAAAVVATIFAGLVMTALFLGYNQALTGRATRMPLEQFTDTTYYPGSNRLGFGADIGNWGWSGLDALPGHGLVDVVMNTNHNLYLVNFELFGWASGSLLFVFLLLAADGLRRNGLMWSLVLATLAGLSLYWFSGGPDFGARYWYQMLVPLTVLTLLGAQALAARWREASGPGAPAEAGTRVWAFVALATLLGSVNLLPWRSVDKYHNYRGVRSDLRALARERQFGHSLVLIRGSRWPDYAAACALNPPRFERDVPGTIYALELGPESIERLRTYYSDRTTWVVAGPSKTSAGFQIVEGPVRPGVPLYRPEPTNR